MTHTFNLSLDDQSPHPKAGLNFESIEWCNRLIEHFPGLKIDLFVPTCYARLGEKSYRLSDYPEWCDRMRALPDNYRLNLHGHYHRRFQGDYSFHRKWPKSNNDELQYLSEKQALMLLRQMDSEFNQAKLVHSKVIRPPGWKISRAAAQSLKRRGYWIAGDGRYEDRRVKASYNWDLLSPCVLEGSVYAYGHSSSWCNNYFDVERYRLVERLLESRDFEFRFLGE